MKTNFLVVVMLVLVLSSCAPGVPTQEVIDTATETPLPQATMTNTQAVVIQDAVVAAKPTATVVPTITPTSTQEGCVVLLSPAFNIELPAIGKITFSWEPLNGANYYVLDIIQPSGATVSFETKGTFRDQYMEAFPAAGTYHWRVIVQDRKRNEICKSELVAFSKSAYDPPRQPASKDKKKK